MKICIVGKGCSFVTLCKITCDSHTKLNNYLLRMQFKTGMKPGYAIFGGGGGEAYYNLI